MKEKSVYTMPKFLLLSFICLLLTFSVTSGLLVSLTTWRALRYNELPNAVASVHLEDITIEKNENEKESLAQYILDNFVKDDRITAEQIQKILESGDFTTWAGWMVGKYSDYLSDANNEKSEFPELSEEDIIALIEENADLIYQETGLRFLEPDKEKLLDTLKAPVEEIDEHLDSSLNSGAGGVLTKFFLSWQCWTVSGIILVLLLAWEIVIHKRSQKRTGSALQAYSIAGAIPCLAFFLAGTCSTLLLNLADMPFLKDSAKAIKGTLTAVGGIGVLVCIVLFVAGMTANLISAQLRTEEQENNVSESVLTDDENESFFEIEETPVLETVPPSNDTESEEELPPPVPLVKVSAPKPTVNLVKPSPSTVNLTKVSDTEPPQKPIVTRKFCRFCGKPLLMQDALFCGNCGKSQVKSDSRG